jgi:flavin reductase (DIM6/NTAB) family NADH-FMN oxidoreductase RutF
MGRRPAGVCVLGMKAGGHVLLVALTDVASASLHPPMVSIAVYADSRAGEAIESGAAWGLSVLDSSAEAAAALSRIREPGRPLIGQAVGIGVHEHDSGAVLLDAASATIACATEWTMPAGEHLVVAGRVLDAVATPRSGAHVHALGRIRPWRSDGAG